MTSADRLLTVKERETHERMARHPNSTRTLHGYVARQDVQPMFVNGHGRWQSPVSGYKLNNSPSHWMPLPDPPKAE